MLTCPLCSAVADDGAAGTSLFGMIVVIVLAVYVFYTSLGGQKVFTRNPLEE